MTKIVACISTRKRPSGLEKLLNSINEIIVPREVGFSLVIVENDVTPESAVLIDRFAERSRFKVRYFLEPNLGISYARNRSVSEAGDCDFCCFVDDDQIVDQRWLVELIKCQQEFDADGVSGATPPLFNGNVPEYVRDFHSENHLPYGTVVTKAATGCLLIRKKLLDAIDGPFNPDLNFTGGEDYYMTFLATKKGGVIRANPNAISFEIVPDERTTMRYIIRRTFRTANTQILVQSLTDPSFMRWKLVPRMVLRFINGSLLLVPCFLFCRREKLKGLFKISYSLGVLVFLLGRKNRFYQ